MKKKKKKRSLSMHKTRSNTLSKSVKVYQVSLHYNQEGSVYPPHFQRKSLKPSGHTTSSTPNETTLGFGADWFQTDCHDNQTIPQTYYNAQYGGVYSNLKITGHTIMDDFEFRSCQELHDFDCQKISYMY